MSHFPDTDGLDSNAFRCVIELVLLLTWAATGTIESLHALVRRIIMATSLHTHLRQFCDVNACWLMASARRMEHLYKCINVSLHVAEGQARKPRLKRKRMSDDAEMPETKKQTRPGGPWRAYVRTRLLQRGVLQPLRSMGAAIAQGYHQLAPAEKARYKEEGRQATRAAKVKDVPSASSFGPRPREQKRSEIKAFHTAMLNRCKAIDDGVENIGALAEIERNGGSLLSTQAIVNLNARIEGQARLSALRDDLRQLAAYEAGPGAEATTALQAMYPDALIDGAVPFPTASGGRLHYAPGERGVHERHGKRAGRDVASRRRSIEHGRGHRRVQ